MKRQKTSSQEIMFLISLEMFLTCEGLSSHFRTFQKCSYYAWPFQENEPLLSKDITISTWAGLWSGLFCFYLSPVFYQISFLMCLIQSTCFMKTEKHGLIYSINSNLTQNSAPHPVGGRRGISQRRKVLKMNRHPRYVCKSHSHPGTSDLPWLGAQRGRMHLIALQPMV